MRYLDVCSGISAPTVAWKPLGFECVGYSEVEAFPSAVLAHHYPEVRNFGDLTGFKEWEIGCCSGSDQHAGEQVELRRGPWAGGIHDQLDARARYALHSCGSGGFELDGSVDVIVGGTPCQSFSVAGLRAGLDDPRGRLALVYLALVERVRPRWVVWENVPGVLSADGGRAFGAFLGALGQLGYGWSYRVLDAQHFGVAQRRRRVFVVGSLRGWSSAAAVLFEREGLQRNPAPSREAGQGATYSVAPCIGASGRGFERAGDTRGQDCVVASTIFQDSEYRVAEYDTAGAIRAGRIPEHQMVCSTLGASGAGTARPAGNVNETGFLMLASGQANASMSCNASPSLSCIHEAPIVARVAPCLNAHFGSKFGHEDQHIDGGCGMFADIGQGVRRLTPTECERLQGFPDGYTDIPYRGKPSADSHRYKALGNSMAVPVVRWIGERLKAVDAIERRL